MREGPAGFRDHGRHEQHASRGLHRGESIDRSHAASQKPGNADSLLASIANLGDYDTGGFVVSYAPDKHHGSKYVALGMVSRDGRMRN